MKNDLFNLILQYIQDVEKIYSSCNEDNDVFENMNLSSIQKNIYFQVIMEFQEVINKVKLKNLLKKS